MKPNTQLPRALALATILVLMILAPAYAPAQHNAPVPFDREKITVMEKDATGRISIIDVAKIVRVNDKGQYRNVESLPCDKVQVKQVQEGTIFKCGQVEVIVYPGCDEVVLEYVRSRGQTTIYVAGGCIAEVLQPQGAE